MVWNFMITEYLRRSVRVEASSYEKAYDKVVDAITSERVVLDAEDFTDRDIQTFGEYDTSMGERNIHDRTNDPALAVGTDLTGQDMEETE